MAPCFSSFLKTFCFPSCHIPSSSSSSSSLAFDDDDDSVLNNHHVIILEIRQQAMMKARSQPRSAFMIMTEEELERLIWAVAPHVAEGREKKKGFCDGEEGIEEEEFFSARSCFSLCSSGGEEYFLGRKMVMLSEEWFGDCEGWPFGLWRRRTVVVLPPLPKSPSESWTWHKRNLSNVKV